MENWTFTQILLHFWIYKVKKLKGDIMAKMIWPKILFRFLSPMTTAEEGNPFQWTGGMRGHLSYRERLLQCPLHGWLSKFKLTVYIFEMIIIGQPLFQAYSTSKCLTYSKASLVFAQLRTYFHFISNLSFLSLINFR